MRPVPRAFRLAMQVFVGQVPTAPQRTGTCPPGGDTGEKSGGWWLGAAEGGGARKAARAA